MIFFSLNRYCTTKTYTAMYCSLTGSDTTGTGSFELPYRTIEKAIEVATNRTKKVKIMAGTWNIDTAIDVPVQISIEGEGSDKTIIMPNCSNVFNLISSNKTDGNQYISNLKLDGNNIGSKGVSVFKRNNVIIQECEFANFTRFGISFGDSSVSWSVAPSEYYTGNQVINCEITDCCDSEGNFGYGAISFFAQKDCTIRNNIFRNDSRAPGRNGDNLKGAYFQNLQVYENTLYRLDNNDKTTEFGLNWNLYCELFFTQGSSFNNNNLFGAGVVDFVSTTKGEYSYGLKVHNNNFEANSYPIPSTVNGSVAIDIESRGNIQDLYIYNNKIKGYQHGIFLLTNLDLSENNGFIGKNVYIYNNSISEVGVTSNQAYSYGVNIEVKGTAYTGSWDNINIWNNSIRAVDGSSKGYSGIDIKVGGAMTNINIINNILNNFASTPIRLTQIAGVTGTLDIMNAKNNCWSGTPRYTYAPTNKIETNNITNDPVFVSSIDLHLQSTSPCKTAGLHISEITKDIEGNSYTNPPSIGAYQYIT